MTMEHFNSIYILNLWTLAMYFLYITHSIKHYYSYVRKSIDLLFSLLFISASIFVFPSGIFYSACLLVGILSFGLKISLFHLHFEEYFHWA